MRISSYRILSHIVVFLALLSACKTTGLTDLENLGQLKEDEGFVVMWIHNETAGKKFSFYSQTGETLALPELVLNSNVEIQKAPVSFSFFVIENTTAPLQRVIFKAKEGLYGIVNVGKNSAYFDPYKFTVQAGAVNYAGEIHLRLMEGEIPLFMKPRDWYELSVVDSFSAAMKEISAIAEFSDLPVVNISTPTAPMKPEFYAMY